MPNVFVSKACEASQNAEAVQAVDPTNGNIYEAWTGCEGIGFALTLAKMEHALLLTTNSELAKVKDAQSKYVEL